MSRLNPPSAWVIKEVPELRIVDDALWDAVKARQAEVRLVMSRETDGNALNGAHRQKYLLSGLLACGVCGGGFTIVDAHHYGCGTHRAKETCDNHGRIRREELERRVLDGLKHWLLAPERVEQFARDFQGEVNRQTAELSQSRAQDQGQLDAVRRKIASMIRAIEDGLYQPSMKGRMAELGAEKAALEERLASAPALPKVQPPPNLAGAYRAKVAALEQALADPLASPPQPRRRRVLGKGGQIGFA